METGLKAIRNKIAPLLFSSLLLFSGCYNNSLVDVNTDMPENNWAYPNKVKAEAKIKNPADRYNVYFKLRVTASYRYSNIYVLFKIKGNKGKEVVKRYGFKLAEADGQWLGKGSGDLYAYKLQLLKNYRFLEGDSYSLSIEQNMRDNPLTGISDAGLQIEQQAD